MEVFATIPNDMTNYNSDRRVNPKELYIYILLNKMSACYYGLEEKKAITNLYLLNDFTSFSDTERRNFDEIRDSLCSLNKKKWIVVNGNSRKANHTIENILKIERSATLEISINKIDNTDKCGFQKFSQFDLLDMIIDPELFMLVFYIMKKKPDDAGFVQIGRTEFSNIVGVKERTITDKLRQLEGRFIDISRSYNKEKEEMDKNKYSINENYAIDGRKTIDEYHIDSIYDGKKFINSSTLVYCMEKSDDDEIYNQFVSRVFDISTKSEKSLQFVTSTMTNYLKKHDNEKIRTLLRILQSSFN